MSGHHKNSNDTLISSAMLSDAISELAKKVALDRNHDIPYLAGYSVDRSKIYIDRHLQRTYQDHLGKHHEVDKFLILHEATEMALIDLWKLHYQHAHQIALRAEEAAVRAAGLQWREYDAFMQRWIKRADSEKITMVPATLDLIPYLDEDDSELIEVMQRAMVP
ncbi:hypothetical protein HYR53_01710 [Candidatus Acetothermia bacterium]|nr:hypothetical protein [Candidatus Acetothermia bacterium]